MSNLIKKNIYFTLLFTVSLFVSCVNKNQEKIIDDFIQGKQLQKSTPFFSPLETAKLSLVDNDEFVTETLAEIHVKQGNYPKAIKIYENLMLKFPEKNTFFASRIRFIQEKSNYK